MPVAAPNAFLLPRTAKLAVICALLGSHTALHAQGIAGQWEGTAALPGQPFTLRVDITPGDTGINAVMDIPESRLIRFAVPEARFASGALRLAVPAGWGLAMFRDIGLKDEEQVIVFEGSAKGDSIVGTLQLAYAKLPLTLRRPRSETLPYRREDVTFRNGDVSLAGTLYLPEGTGRFPLLLFTHGSGDRTRDSYAKEADQLARAGIAALVYDKRGAGKSTGANWRVASLEELAGDAAAGVRYVRQRREIDPRRIGLFGLSQGAWIIAMVARESHNVGFLIFASGSGIPVWEQDIYRTTAMMRAHGFDSADVAEAESYQRLKHEVSRTGLGWARLDSLTKALQARPARWFSDYGNEYSSLTSARFWWLAMFHHDPTPLLERIDVPVLGVFGDQDLSFPIPMVVERLQGGLSRAGNCDVTLKVFPGAEHQLMVVQDQGGRHLRRAVTPAFAPLLIDWIQKHEQLRKCPSRHHSAGD